MIRAFAFALSASVVLGGALRAQCPDGTPPQRDGSCGHPTPRPTVAPPELKRLTLTGRVTDAQFSSDGKLLAYMEDGVLYVTTLVAGARPVEVSRDWWRFRTGFGWLPDNARLLTRGDSGTFIVPAFGGVSQQVHPYNWSFASISPDGRLAMLSDAANASILDLETGARRRLRIQSGQAFHFEHAFSRDGSRVVVVSTDGKRGYQLTVVSVETGVAQPILRDSVRLFAPQWDAATNSIVYLRGTQPIPQLWRQPVSATGAASGAPRVVQSQVDAVRIQLVDGGNHLAYLKVDQTINYFIRGLADDSTNHRLTNENTGKLLPGRFSPDGRLVAFVQVQVGGDNMLISRVDSLAPEQVTVLRDRSIGSLDWSPDGKRIGLCTTGESAPAIAVLDLQSRHVTTLRVTGVSDNCGLVWIGNDTLAYQLAGNRNFAVHSVTGGHRGRLVENDSMGWIFWPTLDRSRNRLAVHWTRVDQPGVWMIDLATSTQQAVPGANPVRFSSDGSMLYVTLTLGKRRPARVRLGNPMTTDTLQAPSSCFVLDVLPDGTKALCLVEESRRSDVWMLRNFDPTRRRR